MSSSNDRGGDGPLVALLERRTTLVILAIGSAAAMAAHLVELFTDTIAAHDRIGQPVLAAVLVVLFLRLRARPDTLVNTQKLAVALLYVYFSIGVMHLSLFNADHITTYWVATTYMWMILISLLMHLFWPQRQALLWSLLLIILVTIPPVVVRQHMTEARWEAEYFSLALNSLLAQAAVLVSLGGVARLRQSVMQVLTTEGPVGPSDARQALERWFTARSAALAEAKDSAEAASQAKSQFLAVMSHELRTPLHAMMVSADLLAERPGGNLPEREARLINTIQSSGQHLLALIDQVLDLTRIEAGKAVLLEDPLDLTDVCRRATEAVSPMTQHKGLSLSLEIDPAVPMRRRGDALRITQILINLLANACKFTDHGGIQLKVSPAFGDEVRFEIIDTGPGLSAEAQTKVFEPFYQVHHESTRRHAGVGLGLTITRDLVTMMGGVVELRSQLGSGTTVEVTVPLALGQHPPINASTAEGAPLDDIVGTRVLVVEDDPVNSMLACEVINGAGAYAVGVESGEAALTYLQNHIVDLILMDFRMPGMDGLEATRRIRAGEAGSEAQRLPIVGLTANAYLEDRQDCLSAGMSEVLTKPIERRQLVHAVAQWRCSPSP